MTKKKKRILLVNPPIEDVIDLAYRMQPVGLLKIGAYLKSLGHKVDLIDFFDEHEHHIIGKAKCGGRNSYTFKDLYHCGMPYDDFRTKLKHLGKIDEVYVTSSMTYYWKPVHEVVRICKETLPKSKILLGGMYATLCPEHAKKSRADVVYEGVFPEAELFAPALELFANVPSGTIIKSTRGCPNNCSYCAVHILEGNRMRYRPPESVTKEIKRDIKEFGITSFHFWESNILVNAKNHFEKILDLIIKNNLKIELKFNEGFQPNLFYLRLAKKMKKAGINDVILPLESADEEVYKRFHRKTGMKDIEKAANMLKKVGFNKIIFHILIGMPEQRLDGVLLSVIKTIQLGCVPKVLYFTPIPGTEEYENYYSLIKNKTLDELGPHRYPFANPDFSVQDMDSLLRFGNAEKFTFRDLLIINDDRRVFRKLKEIILKNNLIDYNLKKFRICITTVSNTRSFLKQKEPKKEHKRFNELCSKINERHEKGCETLVLSGGEPLIHPRIIEIVEYARKAGYPHIEIETNGRMLAYGGFCKNLVYSGAYFFKIPIYGHNAKIHDSMTGVKGSFKETIQGIKNIKNTKLTDMLRPFIDINIFVHKKNKKHVPEIEKLAKSLNADKISRVFI